MGLPKRITPDRNRTVCLVSPHPLVLGELTKMLSATGFCIEAEELQSSLAPNLRRLVHPKAAFYVVDAHMPRPAVAALVSSILDDSPTARILVIGGDLTETEACSLLRLGVKGLLSYAEAKQLQKALQAVASGGLWVPRRLLSRFVDSVLARGLDRPVVPALVSAREEEVLEALLQDLSNKEIAARLYISERTVKFHVSNLLSKFGVSGRQGLILTCLTDRRPVNLPRPGPLPVPSYSQDA
jgi:DNA-binding NarL/FixJ family response regulator